ncbi:MAG: glutaredoxin family protein [Acidiferrobacterales bacterium]
MAVDGSYYKTVAVFSLAVFLAGTVAPVSYAGGVIRSVDDEGRVHFSNEQNNNKSGTGGEPTPDQSWDWTDSQGRKIYSDRSPEEVRQERRQIQLRMECLEGVTEVYTGPATAGTGRVVLLTAQWCASSNTARAYLIKNRIKFVEYDIDLKRAGRVLYQQLPRQAVPAIIAGNQRLFGFRADLANDILKRSGHLSAARK